MINTFSRCNDELVDLFAKDVLPNIVSLDRVIISKIYKNLIRRAMFIAE